MPNYGKNLIEFLDDVEPGVSKLTVILDVMQQLINCIEYVHFKGFTHNDIKPQNIMIGGNQTVTLVDFGAADSISNRSQTVKTFSGNPMFASLYQLKFIKTSMRDDLISIYQMMIYLITDDHT